MRRYLVGEVCSDDFFSHAHFLGGRNEAGLFKLTESFEVSKYVPHTFQVDVVETSGNYHGCEARINSFLPVVGECPYIKTHKRSSGPGPKEGTPNVQFPIELEVDGTIFQTGSYDHPDRKSIAQDHSSNKPVFRFRQFQENRDGG